MGNLQPLVQKYISWVWYVENGADHVGIFYSQKLNSNLYKIKLNQILTPEVKLVEK